MKMGLKQHKILINVGFCLSNQQFLTLSKIGFLKKLKIILN